MEGGSTRFKQFTCGWAMFQSESDDEVTDGWSATYEEIGTVAGSERREVEEVVDQLYGGGEDEVFADEAEGGSDDKYDDQVIF